MKRILALVSLVLCMVGLCGCEQVVQQVENVAKQIDVEAMVTNAIENIDWNQLEQDAKKGYDALTERFPSLKSENVKSYLKTNGLDLLNSYMESTDADTQENARKLGEILKILNPELADEVDSVIAE